MKPKIALLISTALTAFVVTIAYGLVTRINSQKQAAALAPQAAAAASINAASSLESQPAARSPLTPDQAVNLAATAINRQDVYSVELVGYQGFNSYKVTFSSGDVVYIGMNGNYLDRTMLPSPSTPKNYSQPIISVQANAIQSQAGASQGRVAANQSAGNHESDGETEHEGN